MDILMQYVTPVILLNLFLLLIGVYICYRILRAARRTGRRIKKNVKYWIGAATVIGNAVAIVSQYITKIF